MKHRLRFWPRRIREEEDGQAFFEFALLLPILVIAILFIVDGGVWMYKWVTVANAVRDTARYASVDCGGLTCDVSALETRLENSSSGIVSCPAECDVHWIDRGAGLNTDIDQGDSIVIEVHHQHSLLFVPGITLNVSSCVEMRMETGNSEAAGSGEC